MKKVISFDLDGTLVQGKFGDMVWRHGIPGKYAEKYGVRLKEAQRLILKDMSVSATQTCSGTTWNTGSGNLTYPYTRMSC